MYRKQEGRNRLPLQAPNKEVNILKIVEVKWRTGVTLTFFTTNMLFVVLSLLGVCWQPSLHSSSQWRCRATTWCVLTKRLKQLRLFSTWNLLEDCTVNAAQVDTLSTLIDSYSSPSVTQTANCDFSTWQSDTETQKHRKRLYFGNVQSWIKRLLCESGNGPTPSSETLTPQLIAVNKLMLTRFWTSYVYWFLVTPWWSNHVSTLKGLPLLDQIKLEIL